MPMVVAIALVIMLFPFSAFAFGPVAHVSMGLDVIGLLSSIAPQMAEFLMTNQRQFLLGTLDPDRMLAKNLAQYSDHSHNWDNTFDFLRKAQNDQEKARIYGYLCHLAADTVAHQFYVPVNLLLSWNNTGAGHTFFEARFDQRLRARGNGHDFSSLCKDVDDGVNLPTSLLKPTVLNGPINLKMTALSFRVQRARAFIKAMGFIDRSSRIELTDAHVDEVLSLAIGAQLSVMVGTESAPVAKMDPRGIDAIENAKKLVKVIRTVKHRRADENAMDLVVTESLKFRRYGLMAAGIVVA